MIWNNIDPKLPRSSYAIFISLKFSAQRKFRRQHLSYCSHASLEYTEKQDHQVGIHWFELSEGLMSTRSVPTNRQKNCHYPAFHDN